MRKILVVDDVELNRELLYEILKDEYEVRMAEDGEEVMQKLEVFGEELAALLLDLHMPKMDGLAVIAAIKEKGWLQKIPVLVISCEPTAAVENQCLELGVSDFIRRPFESSIVKNRIKNTIELFACKNQLEQKVAEQYRIIQLQAEKLREAKPFNQLMMEYNRNPFESIKSRLKSATSIYKKLDYQM